MVPEEHFANAVAWNATTFQAATILGPSLGGILYAAFHGPSAVYAMAMITGVGALLSMFRIKTRPQVRREPTTAKTIFAGLNFIWREKLILGAISLDLFAVLLGRAVALLPVYAPPEILPGRPWAKYTAYSTGRRRGGDGGGTGASSTAIESGDGAIVVGGWVGIFTIIFGVSKSLVLSLVSLILLGAADMISVIIRATLTQLRTPDEMRGRVTAVDMIFIGTSNEFGQFESGVTAQWFGTVPAVVLGGIGTLVVIGLWAWMFPELHSAGPLDSIKSATAEAQIQAAEEAPLEP